MPQLPSGAAPGPCLARHAWHGMAGAETGLRRAALRLVPRRLRVARAPRRPLRALLLGIARARQLELALARLRPACPLHLLLALRAALLLLQLLLLHRVQRGLPCQGARARAIAVARERLNRQPLAR